MNSRMLSSKLLRVVVLGMLMVVVQAVAALAQAPGAFSMTGSMAVSRSQTTGTRLANGKVLIAGGFKNIGGPLASAEVYDPATGTFSPTGGMAFSRNGHTATLLANGRVLIAGGSGNGLWTRSSTA